MLTYKPILKKLLIISVLDVIILSVLVWWINADPSEAIAEIIILPSLLIINLIIAGLLAFFKIKKSLAIAFSINSIVACIVFHILFVMWFTYYDSKHFTFYYFNKGSIKYEILLMKEDTSFGVLDISNKGSSIEFMRGNYKLTRGGIVLLTDSMKKMLIINNKLIGYPTPKDTIDVTKDQKLQKPDN